MYKRGEIDHKAGGAAGLVAIIAGLIAIYILFLPPSDRADILDDYTAEDREDHYNNGNGNGDDDILVEVIFSEDEIGRIDFLRGDDFEIDLPSFNLFKTTESTVIDSFNDFRVYNGVFDKQSSTQRFYVDDFDNTDNILLSFSTSRHKGVLRIDLNGENIYEADIETATVEPIVLRKQKLVEGENTLNFSVSGVGIAFWSTNEYGLNNVKVIGEVTDVSRQMSRNSFTVEAYKYNNLEKAFLKFSPECRQSDVGILTIEVNGRELLSQVPDCGLLNKHPIPVTFIEPGTNNVIFKTEEGNYLIDRISVDIELEELTYPLYWFEIEKPEFKNITEGLWDVNLTLEFVDVFEDCNLYDDIDCERNRNVLDLNVNGHLTRINEDDAYYSRNISHWVEEGRNYVRLEPRTTGVEVVELQILKIDYDEDN